MVTGPRADIGHGRAARDFQGVKHGLGLLFINAGLAKQPVDTLPRHHVRDLTTHVEARRIATDPGFALALLLDVAFVESGWGFA